jgi:hypothetical protein
MLSEQFNRQRKPSAVMIKESMRRMNICKKCCANIILLPRNIITMMSIS